MLNTSLKAKFSKQPSSYPPVAFHVIRISQFLSAAVVLSILSFFVKSLEVERYRVPWTFILLLTVSVLTLFILIITGIYHHLRALSPTVNLVLNGLNTILWALGFALLIWNTRSTLRNRCTQAIWHSEGGVMVCRLYKALATFTITGLLSTAFSLVLDLRTRRIFHHRGAYNSMQDVKISLPIISNEHNFAPHQDYSSPGSVSYETSRPYMMQRPMEARQFGYTIPSEQTTYDGPSSSHWL